jgi:hypothetical protein
MTAARAISGNNPVDFLIIDTQHFRVTSMTGFQDHDKYDALGLAKLVGDGDVSAFQD